MVCLSALDLNSLKIALSHRSAISKLQSKELSTKPDEVSPFEKYPRAIRSQGQSPEPVYHTYTEKSEIINKCKNAFPMSALARESICHREQ